MCATFAAFHPAWSYDFGRFDGFVWDDDDHYLSDPLIAAPDGWWRIWVDPQPGIVGQEGGAAVWNYWPLSRSSFWLDRHLFGVDANGRPDLRASHLVNVGLHALNAVLVFLLLRRLRVPGAALAGLIFAVHPVTVESVAWLTERKNVLSTCFVLLAALAWLGFLERGGGRRYAQSVLLFLLALMAKTATVMFPVVLVLLQWARREPFTPRALRRLAPFFGLSLIAGLTSIHFERRYISSGAVFTASFAERIAGAGQIVWFYLGKLLFPVDLAFNYPRWQIDPAAITSYGPTLAVAIVAALLFGLRDRGARPVALALGSFVALLFPVLGFFDLYGMRYARVADHWQYLPAIAVIALVTAALTRAADRFGGAHPRRRLIARCGLAGVSSALLALLAFATWQQSGAYRDSETLWRHTLARQPDSAIAHNNLGTWLRGRGRLDEADAQFRLAIEADPDFAEPYLNRGNLIHATTGDLERAAPFWRQALERDADQPIALYNLSLHAFARRDIEGTEALLVRALAAEPTFPLALEMLGRLHESRGRAFESVPYFERARALATARRADARGVTRPIGCAIALVLIGAAAVSVDEERHRASLGA